MSNIYTNTINFTKIIKLKSGVQVLVYIDYNLENKSHYGIIKSYVNSTFVEMRVAYKTLDKAKEFIDRYNYSNAWYFVHSHIAHLL